MVYSSMCGVLKSISKPGNNSMTTNMQLSVLMTAIIAAISGTTGRLKLARTSITCIKGVYTCDGFCKYIMNP